MPENYNFNEVFRNRTKKLAVAIILFYSQYCKSSDELKIIGKQLLRSGTSVAANFRAYTRGRSVAERYSKICIVVEEADETQFWFELIEEAKLLDTGVFQYIKNEIDELTKVFTALKSKIKSS